MAQHQPLGRTMRPPESSKESFLQSPFGGLGAGGGFQRPSKDFSGTAVNHRDEGTPAVIAAIDHSDIGRPTLIGSL